jgi:hypothetical protein
MFLFGFCIPVFLKEKKIERRQRKPRSCEKEFMGIMGSEVSDEFKEASEGRRNAQCLEF